MLGAFAKVGRMGLKLAALQDRLSSVKLLSESDGITSAEVGKENGGCAGQAYRERCIALSKLRVMLRCSVLVQANDFMV